MRTVTLLGLYIIAYAILLSNNLPEGTMGQDFISFTACILVAAMIMDVVDFFRNKK